MRAGWELWEKVPFVGWSDLEAARLGVLLQRDFPLDAVDADPAPVDGVKALLRAARLPWREVAVGKQRIQARAGDLGFTAVPRDWLAELVEIDIEGRRARSICFETMTPADDVPGAVPRDPPARNVGYPELLISATSG